MTGERRNHLGDGPCGDRLRALIERFRADRGSGCRRRIVRPNGAGFGRAAFGAVLGALVVATGAWAETGDIEHSFSGRYSLESRWYPQSPAYPGQRSHATGFVVEPTLFLEDPEGRSFTLTPFFRGDGADSRRTHADVREAYLLLFGELDNGEWEARIGIDRVFWGVAELYNPVDIVNQSDLVEHPDGKTKLGQPMAHLTFAGDWGTAELFALPWHRERTFPGRRGRLRSELVVDPDLVEYESGAEERHLDVAARYSHSFGLLDIGLSVFDGTSREPSLRPASPRLLVGPDGLPLPGPDGRPIVVPTALAPYYPQIRQFGLDAQITAESFLLKLEAIHRTGAPNVPSLRHPFGEEEDYTAFVIGGEYTIYSLFESAADLSLLGEWHRDDRGRRSTHQFQDDVFLAARLAFNDVEGTEVTAAIVADTDYGSRTMSVEFSRRLSDEWSLRLETTAMLDIDEADPIRTTWRDSFIGAELTYSF